MIFLTISASLTALRPQQCPSEDLTCPHPSLGQSAFLFFSLYVVDLGAGAFQSVVTSFGADQFDEEDPKEKPHKTSFFNWFYQAINIGGLLAGTFLVYIQDKVNWGLGFGVALIAIVIGTFCFLAGTPYYRHHPPGGNPLARIGQVMVASARKWHIQMPLSSDSLYEVPQEMESNIKGSRKIRHTDEFRYKPMLDQYIEECMVSKEPSCGYRNCNTSQIFIFGAHSKEREPFVYPSCYLGQHHSKPYSYQGDFSQG